MDHAFQTLAGQQYVLLTTFRKTGVPVKTPLWVVGMEGKIYIYSLHDTGKMKRLKNNPQVTLQPCSFRGVVPPPWKNTPPVEGTGKILTEKEKEAAFYRLLSLKYRLPYLIGTLLSRISGKFRNRVVVEITLKS